MKMEKISMILSMAIAIGITGISCELDDGNLGGGAAVDGKPEVTTSKVISITQSTAWCGGHVSSSGQGSLLLEGVCWSTSPEPTTLDSTTKDGSSLGAYISQITNLNSNTTYYVRAYATNSQGVSFGEEYSFTTSDEPSVVPPCTPKKNFLTVGFIPTTFRTVFYHDNGFGFNFEEYGLSGGGSDGDLTIEFSKPPITGKYLTEDPDDDVDKNECIVSGVFRGAAGVQYGSSRDTVYVIKNAEGKYSMSFCDLDFKGGPNAKVTFTSSGNLTVE